MMLSGWSFTLSRYASTTVPYLGVVLFPLSEDGSSYGISISERDPHLASPSATYLNVLQTDSAIAAYYGEKTALTSILSFFLTA